MRTSLAQFKVNVWRGGDEGEFQRFDVPRMESQTVLDVVIHIQRHLDPTLSYRFACRVGMCGSCAMTVNGRARVSGAIRAMSVCRGAKLFNFDVSSMLVLR